MKKNEGKNGKKILLSILTVLVITGLIIGCYYMLKKSENKEIKTSVREKIITQENYEEITNQITEELGDSDDAYYFTFACITYMSEAGLTDKYFQSRDDSMLYEKIYNKTVNQLIEDGKQLMSESETTIDDFKRQINIINNTGAELNELNNTNVVNDVVDNNIVENGT